jgi:hypothetical protein
VNKSNTLMVQVVGPFFIDFVDGLCQLGFDLPLYASMGRRFKAVSPDGYITSSHRVISTGAIKTISQLIFRRAKI